MKRSELQRTPFKRETKPTKGPKLATCQNPSCRQKFVPERPKMITCGPHCAEAKVASDNAKAERKRAKAERAIAKARKESIKSRATWQKEAQQAVNAWVRLVRDADKPCISCGRWHEGQWHCGHYLARGSHPNLALVENNLARQCAPCNVHLSGNQRLFRVGLIARIGLEAVEALEADQTPRKYSVEDLRTIRDEYRARVRKSQQQGE